MKNVFRALAALIIFTFIISACAPAQPAAPAASGGDNAKEYTICFAFQDLETEFWMAGHKAITETLKAKGYNVVEVNSNEDASKQLEQVKNCIAQKVDGIMVIPVDGSIALKLIAEANKAGIPIGIFNRPPKVGRFHGAKLVHFGIAPDGPPEGLVAQFEPQHVQHRF